MTTRNLVHLKRMADFQCMLANVTPQPSVKVVQELCRHYDLVLHADQVVESMPYLSDESHDFLCKCLMCDTLSGNFILQCLLCLWCPAFARTDHELQELYRECLESLLKSIETEGRRTSSFKCRVKEERNFLAAFLLIVSMFEVSEKKEEKLLNWLSTQLLALNKMQVLSHETLYLTLLSRLKLKLFRSFEERFYCDDQRIITDNENLFHLMLTTKEHWMEYVIGMCSRVILMKSSNFKSICLSHPILRKLLPVMSVYSWCNFMGNRDMFVALEFFIQECQNLRIDPVFSRMHSALEHQMVVVKWCGTYSCKAATQISDILQLLKVNSTLETIRKTTNLAEVPQEEVRELVQRSHRQDEAALFWDAVVFEAFSVLFMAFQIIQRAIEIEQIGSSNNPPKEVTSDQERSVQKLYSEEVSNKLKDMQQNICLIFPLNYRLEVMENIFSLLFLRHEHYQEEGSSDSGAEEDYDERKQNLASTQICSDSSGKKTNTEEQFLTSFPEEFLQGSVEAESVPFSCLASDTSRLSVQESFVAPRERQPCESAAEISVMDQSKLASVFMKKEDEIPGNRTSWNKTLQNHCRLGFVCDTNVTRDILHCLKECVVNTNAAFYRVHASSRTFTLQDKAIPSSVPAEFFQLRLNRLSQYISESSWRLQLLADVDFTNHLGLFQHYMVSDWSALAWKYHSEDMGSDSEDEHKTKEPPSVEASSRVSSHRSIRRSKSETEKSSESGSHSAPTGAGCSHHHRMLSASMSKCIITHMLSSKSSLVVYCLIRGEFAKALQVIQMCFKDDSSIAVDVNFIEGYQLLRQRLNVSAEGSSKQALAPPYVVEGRIAPSLQSIKHVATAGVHSTSLTNEVERFLSLNAVQEVSGVKEVIADFPQTVNILKMADNGIGLTTVDLALTVGITYEQSVSLLDLVCKHCPNISASSGYGDNCYKQMLGSLYFMQNLIQIFKLQSTELSYKLCVRDLLCSGHSVLPPKCLKEHIFFWNTVFSELKGVTDRKEHSEFRKLMAACSPLPVKDGPKSPTKPVEEGWYLEWLYAYLNLLSSHLTQTLHPGQGFVSLPTFFEILCQSVDTLCAQLVFNHDVPPTHLEPMAQKIHHNLVYSVVRCSCPFIPDRALVPPSYMKNIQGTWAKLILNKTNEPLIEEEICHPEVAVRTLLSNLLEAFTQHDVIDQKEASVLVCSPEVKRVLHGTRVLAMVNTSLLVPGDQTLAFFINLTNLLWLHCLLLLETEGYGLLSNCPLKRFVSLRSVGYEVGELGFLSLYTLQQMLLGTSESEYNVSLSADPRTLFVLANGQRCSPRIQVLCAEEIDVQLDHAIVDFLNHHVIINESGQLIVPHLLQAYQELVYLNQEPESNATLPALARPSTPNYFSSDTDSAEKKSFSNKEKLMLLMDFLHDNTSAPLQSRLVEAMSLAQEYVIIEEPSYEFSIVLVYPVSPNQIISLETAVEPSTMFWEEQAFPNEVLKFLETHCWVLSAVIQELHPLPAETSSNVEPGDRIRYLHRLHTASWVSTLKATAIHGRPDDKILWNHLNKLFQEGRWELCRELLWALPETALHSDWKLQAFLDIVLCEITAKLPQKGCPNPWQFSHHIGDIAKQTECILRNLPLWPGDACIEALKALLEENSRRLPQVMRNQVEQSLRKITIYHEILSSCSTSDMKSWYDVSCMSESKPGLILKQLINAKKFQLCLQWADLHGIHSQSRQLVDYRFLLLLLDPEPMDFGAASQLLLSLAPEQAIRVCDDVLLQMRNLACIQFIIDFILTNLASSLSSDEMTNYQMTSIGAQMLVLIPTTEQVHYWDLLGQPLLIVEQLIMNTKLQLLEKILECLRPTLCAHPINSSISVNSIDALLRDYARKALDFRVRQAQAPCWGQTNGDKLLVSLSVASSSTEEFVMPPEVPTKAEWVPNDQVAQCMCCKAVTFSMFNRRHHCRRCGRVICGSCSGKRMKVVGYGDVNVRVCDICYEQSHHLHSSAGDLSSGTNAIDSFRESSSSLGMLDFWKLTSDESHNSTMREEFGFEHAPSVSLCLSILQLHSEQTAYPRFLLDSCDRMLLLLQPVAPGAINPEVDHGLVIRMLRSLVVAAKVKYARYGLLTGVVHCDNLLSQVDLLSILVKSGCSAMIPSEPLHGHALPHLRDRLVEEEMWIVALEVSTKGGLDRAGVWAAWGKACLQAGCWDEAREKFSHCFERVTSGSETTRPLRNPPLLNEIIQILETGAYMIDRKILQQADKIKASKASSVLSPALSVLQALDSLKDITAGKYNQMAAPSNTIIIGPKLDALFYAECCYYIGMYGSHAGIVSFYLSHDDLSAALLHIKLHKVDVETFLEAVYLPCLVQGLTSTLHEELLRLDPSLEIWKLYLCHVCHHLERKGLLNVLYQLQLCMQDYVRAAITCIRFYQSGDRSYTNLAKNIAYLQQAHSHLVQWRGRVTNDGSALKLGPREVDHHINTILRQIEVTKFLSNCEEQGQQVLELLQSLFSKEGNIRRVPTLFGNNSERSQVAVLTVLCGKNVEEGFGIAFRIIQDYHLKVLQVFSLVGKKLAEDLRLSDIQQLIGCIRNSGMSDIHSICDEVLLLCVHVLAAKPDPGDVDPLIKLMTDIGSKITAYIECKQLKSAYLQAVKHDRLEDVRRVLDEAMRLGQTAIQKICLKRLNQHPS